MLSHKISNFTRILCRQLYTNHNNPTQWKIHQFQSLQNNLLFTFAKVKLSKKDRIAKEKEKAKLPPKKQEKPEVSAQIFKTDAANTFYRNSIRKANTTTKGRGIFTEHQLLKLVKMVQKTQQQILLYEAYFNFLGHFTLISSRVVDKMIIKILSLGGNGDRILEIFQNHNYLCYYPSYEVTKLVITCMLKQLQQKPQKFTKLIQIFTASPLIKFDEQILKQLIQSLRVVRLQQKKLTLSNNQFSMIVKLLMQRSNFKLFDELNLKKETLLDRLVQVIQYKVQHFNSQNVTVNDLVEENTVRFIRSLKRTTISQEFLNSFVQKQNITEAQCYGLAVMHLLCDNVINSAEYLQKIQGNLTLSQKYADFAEKLQPKHKKLAHQQLITSQKYQWKNNNLMERLQKLYIEENHSTEEVVSEEGNSEAGQDKSQEEGSEAQDSEKKQ